MLVRTLRATVAGTVTLVFSFLALRTPAELFAVAIRRQWPEAWFSGLIVWYADFVAIGFSIAIAVVIGRYAFKP